MSDICDKKEQVVDASLMPLSKRAELILACGGSSLRMGKNKLLAGIGGKPCILRTCEALDGIEEIEKMIICAPKELWREYGRVLSEIKTRILFVQSGTSRQESVLNGVKSSDAEIVIIHDGARPLVKKETIRRSIDDAYTYGSSVVCVPCKDTVRYDDGSKSFCPDRGRLYNVQTPQAFSRRLYLYAAQKSPGEYTDDAQLLDAAGIKPHLTMGEYSNIKLTTAEDIAMVDGILNFEKAPRIGHGYDVHRFTCDRELILGGVKIPYKKGLLGNSDADVAVHALMDSLLGAAALGDIGVHFPDTDEKYIGADSIELLHKTSGLLWKNGFRVINCDITIIAQEPKLAPYIDKMRGRIAAAVGIDASRVSVKATTEEGLGFTGSNEGIAAHAVSLII